MTLENILKKLKKSALVKIDSAQSTKALEAIEQSYFGRKGGEMTSILRSLKDLDESEKKRIGKLANQIRDEVSLALNDRVAMLLCSEEEVLIKEEWIDVTRDLLSDSSNHSGSIHPHTITDYQLEDLFTSLGFMIYDGPELGSDYYCFEALNIPVSHPARDMQDTLYIKGHPGWLMRTHTSECQARILREYGAPVRAVYHGRCFRNESTDARHEHTFYQFEGIMVDEKINYAHLKYLLEQTACGLFGKHVQVRFNPKYYPFVEPGFSGDVTCILCDGKGCSVCKQTGWLEFFGAGVVHRAVLEAGGIDPDRFQGIAFGLGSSRMTQLKYGINDARLTQSADLRFLKQF